MTTDEILVRQQLLSELDKVFPLFRKVQRFGNSFCQKNKVFALYLLLLLYSDLS